MKRGVSSVLIVIGAGMVALTAGVIAGGGAGELAPFHGAIGTMLLVSGLLLRR